MADLRLSEDKELPGAKNSGADSPQHLLREHGPSDISISDFFLPSELWDNKYLFF